MKTLLQKLFSPRWVTINDPFNYGGLPTVTGWYRVMISGDNETDGPHVYHDYPDYETWAWFTVSNDDDCGTFTGVHDEENEMIFAWCGPFFTPSYDK